MSGVVLSQVPSAGSRECGNVRFELPGRLGMAIAGPHGTRDAGGLCDEAEGPCSTSGGRGESQWQ